MKSFEVPAHYRSSILGQIKAYRKSIDPRKKDDTPFRFSVGSTSFLIPRHFGFCYGVENAIEIAFKTIEENKGKRIFLLGEMIHNPEVNRDLQEAGVLFLVDNAGRRLVDFSTLTSDDIVITPAFGTTVEMEDELKRLGVSLHQYNTTCPFVEKVWKRSAELGGRGYTLIVHGKYKHEETRATFSHAKQSGPVLIIRDMKEANELAAFIRGERDSSTFRDVFADKFSEGFDPENDLKKIGVVNQTTMLATETQEIAAFLKEVVQGIYGEGSSADTRDTLCYATNDNQTATLGVLQEEADCAVVVGGFNSSNTFQIATILEQRFPVFFVRNAADIFSAEHARCLNLQTHQEEIKSIPFSKSKETRIIVTSGASCPDKTVDDVIRRIIELRGESVAIEQALNEFLNIG